MRVLATSGAPGTFLYAIQLPSTLSVVCQVEMQSVVPVFYVVCFLHSVFKGRNFILALNINGVVYDLESIVVSVKALNMTKNYPSVLQFVLSYTENMYFNFTSCVALGQAHASKFFCHARFLGNRSRWGKQISFWTSLECPRQQLQQQEATNHTQTILMAAISLGVS